MTRTELLLGGIVSVLGISIYVLLAVDPGGLLSNAMVGTPNQWAEVLLVQLVGLGVFALVRRASGK